MRVLEINYTGLVYSHSFEPHWYRIECWGAEGGSPNSELYGGRGAYTSGIIHLTKPQTLHFYVGQAGSTITNYIYTLPPTFNGGGTGGVKDAFSSLAHHGSSGGGATDVRTIPGLWSDPTSLSSRIMVAGGGGGATSNGNIYFCKGGYGGAPIGGPGVKTGTENNIENAQGGEIVSPGKGGIGYHCNGGDGQGSRGGDGGNCFSTSGGGGGYQGGGGSGVSPSNHQCAAGGSSYISGYKDMPKQDLTFINAFMLSGEVQMYNYKGEIHRGNKGDGHIRVTFLDFFTINSNLISLQFLLKAGGSVILLTSVI